MGNKMLLFCDSYNCFDNDVTYIFYCVILRFFFVIFWCFVDESRRKGLALRKRKRGSKNKQTEESEEGRETGPLPGAQVSAATQRTCTSSDGADAFHHVVAATRWPWRQSVSSERRKRRRNCDREVRKRLI